MHNLDKPLRGRHNEGDGASNHLRLDCLLNRLFRRRSKKTSKLRVTGLCEGIHRWPVDSPHKGPVTQKMFPFDDVIMIYVISSDSNRRYSQKAKQITAKLYGYIYETYCMGSILWSSDYFASSFYIRQPKLNYISTKLNTSGGGAYQWAFKLVSDEKGAGMGTSTVLSRILQIMVAFKCGSHRMESKSDWFWTATDSRRGGTWMMCFDTANNRHSFITVNHGYPLFTKWGLSSSG